MPHSRRPDEALPPDRIRVRRQDPAELIARGDAQLGEHFPQVGGDGVLTEEQARPDVAVGESIAGESCDLSLLGRQGS